MPKYDQVCKACGLIYEIVCDPFVNPSCPECQSPSTERIYLGGYRVISDEVPGGIRVENLGPQPMTFRSKSEMRRYLKANGIEQMVRHVGTKDGDKSDHTQRWV